MLELQCHNPTCSMSTEAIEVYAYVEHDTGAVIVEQEECNSCGHTLGEAI